ncbi:hypothetical protein NLU13_2783 [Sarocladium strictum]|uniref:Gelsolin n=1 Tax=Sarocladium strictum TaxID=5046 RepID=A0AA39L9N6_SARSR|nr:hypothetical protein NLU13_2783 [Sarocladium strictum]
MSDEVSQFLEQVERLRGQQIEEDEVRAKELEDYLAAKRERQARREERARSISPQKSSPANTPSPRSNRRSLHRSSDALRLESPQPHSREASVDSEVDPEGMVTSHVSTSPTKENQSPIDSDAKRNSTSARGSPLSWQRRPTSRGGSRPLSMLAAQNATQRSLAGTQEQQPASATEPAFSKDQIAQALGSKDPSWFRQTADRGQGSAAYRRNQVEDDDRLDMSSVKAQLPGMAAETPAPKEPTPQPTASKLMSPLPLNPPRFDGSAEEKGPVDARSPSPSGRVSPVRTPSPTKGMGGFVQSAMMKRSDSVKRWSVTSPPGLTRADSMASLASTRGAYDRSSVLGSSRPQSVIREKSTTPGSSRPTSRHGEMQPEVDTSTKTIAPDAPIAEALPGKAEEPEPRIPTSPSKTMDPRRWSPTKASWLETALNKPESPKPHSKPGTPTQPTWMAELNKNKPGDGNSRPNSISHKHQVSIGGLMRSSPMGGGARPNSTGLGGIYSPPPGGNRPLPGHSVKLSISKTSTSPEPELAEQTQPAEGAEQLEKMEQTEEPIRKSSAVGPPVTKSKPETPPKKDFRSTLKQRPQDNTGGKTEEPEFKNVFGNLRRTKTQNYVAPDLLKDNITRGKAALNTTGGPKKAERVDEFKEAILKKKDDFKKVQADGKGVTRSTTSAASNPLPEGLAKRAQLGKSGTYSRRDPSAESKPVPLKKPDSPKPSPKPRNISGQPLSPEASSMSPEPQELKKVTTEPVGSPSAFGAVPPPWLQKETSAPSRLQQGRSGGKLADRFNPALASMLARGPPALASNGGQKPEDSTSAVPASSSGPSEPSAPGPQLTHMTKNRARGPKRKAPTSASAPVTAKERSEATEEAPKPKKPTSTTIPKPEPSEVVSLPTEEKLSSSFPIQQQVAAKAAVRTKPTPNKPATGSLEPAGEPTPFTTRRLPSQPERPTEREISPLRPHKTGDAASQPGSPKKLDMKRMSRFLDDSVDPGKPETGKESVRLTHQRTGSTSPVKQFERSLPEPRPSSPTKVDSEPIPSVDSAASKFGGAIVKSPPIKPKPTFERSSPVSSPSKLQGPRTLPLGSTDGAKSPPPVESPLRSPAKNGNEITVLFQDFFGADRPRQKYKVDPAELLMNRPQAGAKVKSSGVQMYQISGDGKKMPVPAHNERVLFDSDMYICSHEFQNDIGKKFLELYFWVGDEVAESVAEEAQLFASREARAIGAKLIKLRQGKETSEFLQALGGVVIIRRGSNTKHDSLAPSMLCGRRYLGEVAFDEVDFSPASLCAGFPYLITKGGSCYLWKGKGCDVDELSCAKLIGMDLALMGELTEVEDGSEPDAFWSLFENGKKPHSADHWRLKPNYSKYGSRLFCSDADSRQQIYELYPFNQSDLSSSSIYILDAFFEMYVIVGSRAQSQYASFRNALDFAQEYAILASGMEDRPFVPFSTVVLEGIPRDLRSVFRKWEDSKSPTVMAPPSGGLRRGRSLRVVPLTQALQALAE